MPQSVTTHRKIIDPEMAKDSASKAAMLSTQKVSRIHSTSAQRTRRNPIKFRIREISA